MSTRPRVAPHARRRSETGQARTGTVFVAYHLPVAIWEQIHAGAIARGFSVPAYLRAIAEQNAAAFGAPPAEAS